MKWFLLAVFAGVLVTSSATCHDDYETCKKTYEDSRRADPAVTDKFKFCLVANQYVSCLRSLSARADCPASDKTTINTDRRRTQEQMQRNASANCMACAQGLDTCINTFRASASQAQNNTATLCSDGQTFVLCAHNVSMHRECAGERNRVDIERRKVEEKLTNGRCETGSQCLKGLEECQRQFLADSANASSLPHDQQCQIIERDYKCQSDQSCSGEQFLKAQKASMDSIVEILRQGNCPIPNKGTNTFTLTSPITVFVALLLAVAVKL